MMAVQKMTDSVFEKQKCQCLSGMDLSRKGSIDAPIHDLIQFINGCCHYFTTSSCSGRIIVVDNEDQGNIKKLGCKWILTSHEPVTVTSVLGSLSTVEGNAVFKFEPFVLHVQCRNLEDAKLLLDCGVASGFRNSGISLGNKGKIIKAVRSTHSLEVPLSRDGKMMVSPEYVEYLVELANKKMADNIQRINRFFTNLKSSDQSKSGLNRKEKRNKKLEKFPIQTNHQDSAIDDTHHADVKDSALEDVMDDFEACNLFAENVT